MKKLHEFANELLQKEDYPVLLLEDLGDTLYVTRNAQEVTMKLMEAEDVRDFVYESDDFDGEMPGWLNEYDGPVWVIV